MKMNDWVLNHTWWDENRSRQWHEPKALLELVRNTFPIPPGMIAWFELRDTDMGERAVLIYEEAESGAAFVRFVESLMPLSPDHDRAYIFTNDKVFEGKRTILNWLDDIFFLIPSDSDHPERVKPMFIRQIVPAVADKLSVKTLAELFELRVSYYADRQTYSFNSVSKLDDDKGESHPQLTAHLEMHGGKLTFLLTTKEVILNELPEGLRDLQATPDEGDRSGDDGGDGGTNAGGLLHPLS